MALSFALVLLIILINNKRVFLSAKNDERAYWLLVKWVLFFCVQDAVWGICASDLVTDDMPLFISSTVFHISTVMTTFFWLYFILTYLGDRVKHPNFLLALDGVVVAIQVAMLTVNFYDPIIFHVVGGRYVTDTFRAVAFLNQYIVYFLMSIVTGIIALSSKGISREKFVSVFFFSLAPVLTGVAQFIYPDGPFYSLGYFLGCFIIHVFVVMKNREELHNLLSKQQITEQTKLANTDELTSLLNRHAYEDTIRQYHDKADNLSFVYIALDINGLKVVNDTQGHIAGDELIIGAAECMRICLGSYGKVFRVGGDEFAAIIHANPQELEFIKRDLEETVMNWHGEQVKELSISVGYVTKREFPEYPITELAAIADERMYEAKSIYYKKRGVDRRGLHTAFNAMCASYKKILKINVSDDTFNIICMDVSEQVAERGFSVNISAWLHNFATSGNIHPDDVDNYLSLTNINNIRDFFGSGNRSLNIFYRRKCDDGYRQCKMEMIPAEDFSPTAMNLYLYVKDIDK